MSALFASLPRLARLAPGLVALLAALPASAAPADQGPAARPAAVRQVPDRQAAIARTAERGAAAPVAAERAAPRGPSIDTVAVLVDHAKVIRLPDRAQTVIIGNPAIADVTVQKSGILVVTGKAYGITNMIALDSGGAMLAESLISVQAPSESLVTVQRGFERESYACTPSCQPSMLLGDSNKHFGEVSGQAGARNALADKR